MTYLNRTLTLSIIQYPISIIIMIVMVIIPMITIIRTMRPAYLSWDSTFFPLAQ